MKEYFFKYKMFALIFLGLTTTTVALANELPNFTQLVETYGPAVVNISTTAKKPERTEHSDKEKQLPYKGIPGLPEDSPFNEFFRHFFDQEEGEPLYDYPTTSLGSGFIISTDGYVVSNNHVVENAKEIIVRLSDRREFAAQVIGSDKRSDIALLKVEATDLPTVKLGSAEALKVGEWVLAIGSPFGFEHSATAGIVSAKGRSLPSDTYVPFIQTDVAINPGNSGGPLFNMKGEVVGINSQIYSRTGGFMGLSFAIPADVMNNVVAQLKATGKVSRGWLGVLIQDVTYELAESFGMERPQGALIAKVLPDSPAQAAGFKVGDIIIRFDGKKIERSSDLPPIVGATSVDNSVTTVVIRQGKQIDLKVTIAELPPEEDIKLAVNKEGNRSAKSERLNFTVVDIADKDRDTLGLDEGGVIIQAVESGPAADAGLRKGDVIIMIDDVEIKDVAHFKELLAELKAGQSVPVLIHRRGSPLFLALKMPEKEEE
jgi:serine protease Do